ncbi:ATP-dependent sacrificial sulfur transferase LarE [Ruminiclostridium herbifermentans]|uniref:ATP-dependent sacrificial sulfur transferase LarE n=1 Tax=Ruminiclostridium herbifermentans TaxID=2488810 RepID=A0A4U7J8V6_9FIRM|nr:ATP-dependent sacrificial sulfur transferase LarE [Ruminiclostridium herbifermentans]QNU67918.1 ATP-dependent sacrificial sulfur transferase LarE [Ruminiclostridium herbifermentans]
MTIYEKLEKLKSNIKSFQRVAIAFSGGVDSCFLLKVAADVLGNDVVAITAHSSTYPERELNEAIEFAKSYSIKHRIIVSEELEVEGFSDNPVNRCYLCKNELYEKIKEIAKEEGVHYILEGSNVDDLGDFRPGMKAVSEHGVLSPLKDAELTKEEIRLLSKELGLKSWNKQAFACLSSRFPYGEKITHERLRMIDRAEQLLLDLGFKQVRVRFHKDIARIEISQDQFEKIIASEIREKIYEEFKNIGFMYTTLDLKGYRTGSLNEGLTEDKKINN